MLKIGILLGDDIGPEVVRAILQQLRLFSGGCMPYTRLGATLCSMVVMFAGSGMASGQNYPNKPIRIVTAQTGGAADLVVRQIAQGLTGSLSQQVIVDNRGGAAGAIAAQTVAKTPADGYTLLAYSSNLWLLPFLRNDVPFELTDFSPITMAASSPNVLVVHPSLPAKSVKELIVFAKGRPGQLSYSSGGSGSTLHLSAELFKSMAGIDVVHVPYKSGGVGLIDLLGGRVQVMFPVAAAAMPHGKTGRLRILAVTSPEPSPLVPGVPTVAASGLPGYASELTVGVFAPVGTSAPIVDRLNREIVRLLSQPDSKEKFFDLGLKPVGSSPEQLMVTVKAEMVKWGKVIKDAGIHAD
ncbi:MAG: tripartite tricarboxylate transporter substrate binding protein [Betaproteobacteria bacterium]|nr:tripartite tricarboxylate transporter substrate binding protein [Betaproteobacteria bacterium]